MSGVPTAAKASAAATAATAAPAGHVAVVDIGSNSVRLVVYDRLARAPVPRFNEKFLCGLGSGLDGSGRLTPKAVACALQALGRFARIARAMEVVRLEAVATEAVRRAVDGAEFLALAERRLRAPIRVLEGSEEARLSALGVAGGFWRTEGVAGDIGGGSLELAEVGPEGARGALESLPLGALRLRQVLAEGRAAAERFIDEALDGVPWLEGAASRGAFYVVGGGWRALARIHLAVVKAPLRIAHGCTIGPEEALKLGRAIAGMERKRLARLAGVPRRRVDTLPPSALLFERVIL
ncbi:MAG TPA: hypothetical protein VFG43_11100, partial [Geminicoccaceae bacterium]|nr:hypothetical protein [Geminicoccaceae bacterium]